MRRSWVGVRGIDLSRVLSPRLDSSMVRAISTPERLSIQPTRSRKDGGEGAVSRRTTSEKLSPDRLLAFKRS